MKLLKVVTSDMLSPFREFPFEIGKQYTCTDFNSNPESDCEKGFYVTDIEGLPHCFRPGRRVFESEVGGKEVRINQFKWRFEKITLLRELSYSQIKKLAHSKEDEVGYRLKNVLFPFNPFQIKLPSITETEMNLMTEWSMIRDSVQEPIRKSIRRSIQESFGRDVWHTVRDIIIYTVGNTVWTDIKDTSRSTMSEMWDTDWDYLRDSTWDAIWASLGYLFPCAGWYYEKDYILKYRFQAAIDLWYKGLIASFDGEAWRLHYKARIVWPQLNKGVEEW